MKRKSYVKSEMYKQTWERFQRGNNDALVGARHGKRFRRFFFFLHGPRHSDVKTKRNSYKDVDSPVASGPFQSFHPEI